MTQSSAREGFTLGQASVPMRLMCSLFILIVALGILSAHVNLLIRVGNADDKSGPPSLEDIRLHFAGNPEESEIEEEITPPDGGMSEHIGDADRAVVIDWVHQGAPENVYRETILPIIDRQCMQCHATADGEHQPILHEYSEILKVTAQGTPPMSVARLSLLTHMHALGMATFYGLLATLLWLTRAPTWVKLWGMVLPLLGVLIDLSGWWLTAQVNSGFAVNVMAGGILQAFGVIPCVFVPYWEMWLRK